MNVANTEAYCQEGFGHNNKIKKTAAGENTTAFLAHKVIGVTDRFIGGYSLMRKRRE